jgi:hypothetical protein
VYKLVFFFSPLYRPELKYRIFVLHELSSHRNIGIGWVHQIRTALSIRVWWEVQTTASRCCGPHHNLRPQSQRGKALFSTLDQSFINLVTVHSLLSLYITMPQATTESQKKLTHVDFFLPVLNNTRSVYLNDDL